MRIIDEEPKNKFKPGTVFKYYDGYQNKYYMVLSGGPKTINLVNLKTGFVTGCNDPDFFLSQPNFNIYPDPQLILFKNTFG